MKESCLLLCLLILSYSTRPADGLVGGIIAAVASCPVLCESTYVACCAAAGLASGGWALILAHAACGTAKGTCYAACYGGGAVAPV